MNRLSVTIVDLLGLLVPGAVFLAGCFFLPSSLAPLPVLAKAINIELELLANPWVAGGLLLAAAYLAGFLLRQISVQLIQIITKRHWAPLLERESAILEPTFEAALDSQAIVSSLRKLSKSHSEFDPNRFAPFFSFSRRLLRQHPNLWAESERLEADLRLLSGLLLPFALLFTDGILLVLRHQAGLTLLLIGLIGAAVVLHSFPRRRVREVRYNYFLALVALRHEVRATEPLKVSPQSQDQKNITTTDENE